ncbi:MAG: cytochrome b [Alphaproteobacteria bacterium]|nr:cytochrome b [Alphaproteobacteria bacterium]
MPQWRNSSHTYGAVSLLLHWLAALMVLVMLGLGWGREFAPGEWKPIMVDLHKSTGMAVLLLMLFRLFWRFYTKPPLLPEDMPFKFRLAARITHGLLYFFLFALPVSGWLMISAMGREPSLYGLVSFPALMEKDRALVPLFRNFHSLTAYVLAGLVVVHVSAALAHHFIFKDRILSRMMPFLQRNISSR